MICVMCSINILFILLNEKQMSSTGDKDVNNGIDYESPMDSFTKA